MNHDSTRREVLLSTASKVIATTIALPVFCSTVMAADSKSRGKADEGPIHKALDALAEARNHLEKAGHDFGGKKEQALRDVNAALKSLHNALEYEERKGA